MKYRSIFHNKKFLESLVHDANKQSLLLEEVNRYKYMPSLNDKSRVIAESQYQMITNEL